MHLSISRHKLGAGNSQRLQVISGSRPSSLTNDKAETVRMRAQSSKITRNCNMNVSEFRAWFRCDETFDVQERIFQALLSPLLT